MAVKKCCIENCNSSSSSEEDIGVTYHKFPKDTQLRNSWVLVTHHNVDTHNPSYVCSRHFCKTDFQVFKDSKYMLKSDAVPSIFSWDMAENENSSKMEVDEDSQDETKDTKDELDEKIHSHKQTVKNLDIEQTDSKDSDNETLDAIKKFLNDQEKDIKHKSKIEIDVEAKIDALNSEANILDMVMIKDEIVSGNDSDEIDSKKPDLATSIMELMMNESPSTSNQGPGNVIKKSIISSPDKGMALSIGSMVEAKDFNEYWHPAEIKEVDYEEMEVLVHYEVETKRHDEWISVSSPRLRPIGSGPREPTVPVPAPEPKELKVEVKQEKQEIKMEEKVFAVGERCLARWRDNRRFVATVQSDLGNGSYEIIFDDGFKWKCSVSRLTKTKETLTVETSLQTSAASTLSPVIHGGPSTVPPPAFHTHLFDPTRDYLGSKSERREKKRKLNIKEIFNIGQKKKKQVPAEKPKKEVKKRVIKKKKSLEVNVKPKTLPAAVASIIGSSIESNIDDSMNEDTKDLSYSEVKAEPVLNQEDSTQDTDTTEKQVDNEVDEQIEMVMVNPDEDLDKTDDASDISDDKNDAGNIPEEEAKLEKFDTQDHEKHEEVIDRIKEAIFKLEGGLVENAPKPIEEPKPDPEKRKAKLSKVKKSKKLRLLQEKKVKKQVEKVKNELEEVKKQMEAMRKEIQQKTEELSKKEMPESFLLPGEWCCKWVNGQPLGAVSELEGDCKPDGSGKPALPRRSVQVEDKRLPPGWTKHMVRRSFGQSAGKWDVVLVSPDNKRFHTKNDMRNYFETNTSETLLKYEHPLFDFGVHMKLARRMGWVTSTPDGLAETPAVTLPAGTLCSTSPLVKRRSMSLKKKNNVKVKIRIKNKKSKKRSMSALKEYESLESAPSEPEPPPLEALEDGFVYVGSLKVQVIDTLLRCPAEGCYKNFRNNTLIKMHIKHYHRELRKMLGATPKVLDLASARTKPTEAELLKINGDLEHKPKVKVPKTLKIKPIEEPKPKIEAKEAETELPVKREDKIPRSLDSPRLRANLAKMANPNRPLKRPKVLLPVRKPEEIEVKSELEQPADVIDFETAISTHTVTKPPETEKFPAGSEDEWMGVTSEDTGYSFPRSGSPDSRAEQKMIAPVSEIERKESKYMYTETGERIKLVHMKREEIINCHCGFREEDGLMVQCELCLCWQHALCHYIQKETDVPEKYTCSICLNPRRGRASMRFVHDQDRLYEGVLPGGAPSPALRRAHELAGNLLRLRDALHSVAAKLRVADKKDHVKLYLWANDWEATELSIAQEKLNSDYSDLNIMINSIGKENLPLKDDLAMDMRSPPAEGMDDRRDGLAQSLLGGLLSSPGSMELPITTSELERLAKSVQEQEWAGRGPVPEAAIEPGACRRNLLRHAARCHALIDARLDSVEAQVAELESQDPSLEDDETADYFPRTKQTIQMLLRDLDTMEELGIIT